MASASIYLDKQILKLSVLCVEQDHGCNWKGEIMNIDEHTSLCEYVQVPCNQCNKEISKGQLETHQAKECPEREYSCPHCNFKDTYSFVTNAHLPVCSSKPVICPNKCGVAGERDDMENHLEDACPLHYLECLFSQAGCKQKFRRDGKEDHMKENIGSHLASLADLTFKMNTRIEELTLKNLEVVEKKLPEEEGEKKEEGEENEVTVVAEGKDERKETVVQEMEEDISNLKRTVNTLSERVNSLAESITNEVSPLETLTESDKMVKDLERKLQEKEAKIEQLSKSLQDHKTHQTRLEQRLAKIEKTLSTPTTPPSTTITFKGFAEMKKNKERWTNLIVNNGPQNNYKLKLTVWPSGQSDGKDTHVSVWLEQDVGDIQNPRAHVFVFFELLNQLGDVEHIHVPCHFPVTSKRYLGAITNQLIEHSELEYNPSRGTHYLVEDSLKFRVQFYIKPIKDCMF